MKNIIIISLIVISLDLGAVASGSIVYNKDTAIVTNGELS